MANVGGMFPSKYIKASDLGGRDVPVTIDHLKMESVGRDKDEKPVLFFRGKQKGLVVNKTNANKIAAILGSQETDHWIGKTILLHPTETEFDGEEVACIRVRPYNNNSRQAAAPLPEPEPDIAEDEPPF
jgi:hypothetical protein